jgi:hypothetical protein
MATEGVDGVSNGGTTTPINWPQGIAKVVQLNSTAEGSAAINSGLNDLFDGNDTLSESTKGLLNKIGNFFGVPGLGNTVEGAIKFVKALGKMMGS